MATDSLFILLLPGRGSPSEDVYAGGSRIPGRAINSASGTLRQFFLMFYYYYGSYTHLDARFKKKKPQQQLGG